MPSPFREPPIGTAFFPSSPAHAADLKLAYAVEQGLEAAVLYGPPGLGKTTLLRRAVARAASAGHAIADVFFPRVNADELIEFIDAELTAEASRHQAETGPRMNRIAAHVRTLTEAGRGVVIAIDDAHLLRDAAFETLHLLLNLREREAARVTVLLAGQPSLAAALARCPSFAQRIALSASLAPMRSDELAAYIRHRLSTTGRVADTFDAEAVATIHARSFGVPRSVDRLCEMALLIATVERRERVTTADVASADREGSGACCDAA